MAEYTLTIVVQGVDQTAPAQKGMEQLGVGGVAAGNILADVAVKAGAALAGLASSSLSVAADFQNATATFASVAGGALAEAGITMADVTNKALEMGAVTQFSAGEAQEAMINLAKGGVPVAEIMNTATQATLDLAAAGEVGLAPAADIVAKQLGVWASTGVTAADVANTLSQAANASTVGVEELALGLSAVGGVAQVSGVSFQDLNQTLAMIIPGFSSASDAGTSFKTMLLAMQGKSSDAIGVMQQLGIITTDYASIADDLGVTWDGSGKAMATLNQAIYDNVVANSGATAGTKAFDEAMSAFMSEFQVNTFYDANGALKDMDAISQILQTSLAGLSEEQKTAALNTMFGTDAYRAAAFIAKAGAEGFDAMGVAMANAGTAAEQAAIRNATFKFAWDSLLGTLETVQIVIGSALLPILTSLVNDALIPAGNAVLAFAQGILSASDPLAAFGAAIDPFLPILTGLATAIMIAVVPGFLAWAGAALVAAAGTLAALAPAIAIGAAIALLYYAWQNNFLGIQDITASVWAYIQPTFNQLVDWLAVAIPAAIQAAAELWSSVLWPALQTVGNFIIGTVIPALAQLASWLATNVPAAIQAAVAAFQTISASVQAVWAAVQAAWQNVVTTTTTAWASVTSAVQSGVSGVVSAFSTFGSVLSTIVQAAWNTVVLLTSVAWAAIQAVVGPGVQLVVSVLQSGWAGLSSIASAAWNAVVGVVAPALAAISSVVSSGVATIGSVWSAGWAVVSSVASSVWGAIQSVIASSIAAVQSAIQGVISFIQSVWGGAQQAAQAQTSAAWNAIATLITGAMLAVRTAITAGVAVVQTIMKTAWAVIVAAAQNDFGKIPAIIQAGWDRVKAIMAAGVAAITAVAGTMAAAALSLGKNIVSGIISGVGSMASALGDKIKSMANSALSAAKSALGIKSPSTVMAAQVGVPIVDGIVAGLGAASPKLTGKMLELAGGMVDLVSKGVDAFGKLRDLGSISFGAIAQFTTTMQQAMTLFAEMAMQWDKAMMSAASQFARKAGEITDAMVKGIEFLLKLQQYQGVAPAVITAFADNLGFAMTELIRISTRELRIGMTAAVEFSLGAGKILDILSKGVDALMKLRTLGEAVPGSFLNFAIQIAALVQRMSEVAGWMDASTVAAAGRFAEGAGKVVGILGSGVDGLIKLATLGAPVPGSFQNFALQIHALVLRMADVATWISADAVAKAAVFAEGAGKVLAIIGSGVDGLTKLATYKGTSVAAMLLFVEGVEQIVGLIAAITTYFSAEGVAAAAVFAEGAGKVLAIIGSGVDGLTKLATFKGVSVAAMLLFVDGVQQIVGLIAMITTYFSAEGVAAAAVFAEGAGKVLAIIGSGVDGLTKLADFKGVSAAALAAFADTIRIAVWWIEQIAAMFSVAGVAAAALFAEGAGKVLAVIGSGVDSLTKLGAFQGVSAAALAAFAETIRIAVWWIEFVATMFSVAGVASAVRFAEGAGKVLSVIGAGVDSLTKLGTFKGVSAAALAAFADTIRIAVWWIEQIATMFSVEGVASAVRFAEGAGKIIGLIGTGVDGFTKLATFAGVPGPALVLFTTAVVALINTVIALANVVSVEALAAAARLAAGINQVIGVVSGAFQAFTALGTASTSLSTFASTFIAAIQKLMVDFAAAVVPPAQNVGTAVTISMANGITAGVPLMKSACITAVNAVLMILSAAAGLVVAPAMIIGNNIAIGIANGITAAAPAIQNAVNAAVNAALAAAQAALGIHSPSKVFEQQIGLQMSAGMAQGILGGMPQVQAAVGDVSAVSAGALTAGMSAGSSTTNSSSITIAPGAIVIDGAGQDAVAVADAVMRRIELAIGGRLA